MRIFIFSALFVLFLPVFASAQNQAPADADSILNVLRRHTHDDTAKVNILNAISRNYYLNQDLDTAMFYAQKALTLANKLNFKKGTATAYRYIGNCYIDRVDSANALAYYYKALAICKEIGDKQDIVSNLRNIAVTYANSSLYLKAEDYYQQALKIAEELHTPQLLISIYQAMGGVLTNAGSYPRALEYFQKALSTGEKAGDKAGTAEALMRIGWIYRNLNDTAAALKYIHQALHLTRQTNQQGNTAYCLSALGNIYLNTKEYKKSWECYKEALDIKKKINDKLGLANDYANVAGLYQFQSDYTTALKYLDSAMTIFKKSSPKEGELLYLLNMGLLLQNAPDSILVKIGINPGQRFAAAIKNNTQAVELADEFKSVDFKLQALSLLIPAYEKQGNYREAYLNLKDVVTLRDSIIGQNERKKIIQKEVEYSFEKKAAGARALQEKKDIKQRTVRNSLLAGISALVFFSMVVFRQRNKVNKEKKRSEQLLLNILPAEVAEELKEKGKAEAHRFDNITVLFTDFVNFTGTSETLTPEELVGELHECFTAFDHIIEKNGLEKIKTIGDAYMAVCGLPNSREDHAQRTIQAALDILDFMHERGKDSVFRIRIGINSGSVVAGIVGVKKFAYDIWGDTVNTAARMEQNSEPGKVNISEITYELVKNDFDCNFRGEIDAKNKGKLKMYFVGSKHRTEKVLPIV